VSRRGRLLSLEGGEGAGKSTQIARLARRLEERGIPAVVTREPGGTEGAEQIRRLLVDGAEDRWDPLAELYLLLAARSDHLNRRILPALANGHWVLCDRFCDSTRIYQGVAGGLGIALVDRLQAPLLERATPDLTLVLDLPAELGLARAAGKRARSRFEKRDLAFHQKVRQGFLALADREPARFAVIDAQGSVEAVEARIWQAVSARMGLPP